MITLVYLAGAWYGKWAFSPWWLAACVVLDVYWISSMYQLFVDGTVEPLIEIHTG